MNETAKRLVTALFMICFVYIVIQYVSVNIFAVILYLVVSLAVIEFVRLFHTGTLETAVILFNGLVIALSFSWQKLAYLPAMVAAAFLTGLYFLMTLRRKDQLSAFMQRIGIHFLALFYLYVPLFFLLLLKMKDPHLLLILIVIVVAGDSAAFFFGRSFGRHRLFPLASPKKTWEGFAAGILFSTAAGWLAPLLFPVESSLTVLQTAATGLVVGIMSQISDPIESLFKRAAGKKDSGFLLPGHGGILDRLDSYVFCAPLFYFAVTVFWNGRVS